MSKEFKVGQEAFGLDGLVGKVAVWNALEGAVLIEYPSGDDAWWVYDEVEAVSTPAIKVDNVNSPSHYKFGNSEVIDIVENLPYNRGNAIKYLARAGRKAIADELEDLRKAQWYINREIDRLDTP